MPRPGPRPYECVRRAWHSDRHKPIRGSMIGQILRMAYDTHSAATKGNREWQDKLPLVVYKAEEIMYSKANSEAEYVSQETLWDRVKDAVNTIIRSDESTETGDLLPPCIEAALYLGCKVERASRSQRHNNPRSYLSPITQEPASVAPRAIDRTHDEQDSRLMQIHSINQLNFSRVTTTVNPNLPVSEASHRLAENNNAPLPHSYPILYENTPSVSDQLTTKEANMHQNSGSVYPLYYGNQYQMEASDMISEVPTRTNSNTIFVGKPIGTSVAAHTDMGVLQTAFSCSSAEVGSTRITKADFRNIHEKPTGTQCDLSLRLGPYSDLCMSTERIQAQENENVGLSISQERDKFNVFSQHRNKEFFFLPGTGNRDPPESCLDKWTSEGYDQNLEATIRKRKEPFSDNVEDGHFCWRSQERDKFSVFSQHRNKEFCFFPGTSNRDPSESCPDKWTSEGDDQNLEATIRKRKAPFSDTVEDGHFCWQSNQFIGRIEGSGL